MPPVGGGDEGQDNDFDQEGGDPRARAAERDRREAAKRGETRPVTPGVVPRPGDPKHSRDREDHLHESGVMIVIDVRTEDGASPARNDRPVDALGSGKELDDAEQ